MISIAPHGTGADRNRRLRGRPDFAALCNEGVVNLDFIHGARPEQKRVCAFRCAMVAVTPASDDETEPVFAGKPNSLDHIVDIKSPHGEDAGL
jgi:hypothetical protein